MQIKGLVGSGLSFRLAAAFQKQSHSVLLVHENPEQAAYFLNDLERLLNPNEVLYFPASYRQPYAPETTDNANILLRAEVLKKLSTSKKPRIVVTYPQAVFEKIISQRTLKRIALTLKKNTDVALGHINERLFEMGFERVDFVTAPGEFAVRGGIIDVFSFAYQHPYRIEFFDETVERLSSFDVVTQRSITAFEEIELLPNTSDHDFTDKRKTLLSFFSENSCFVFADLDKTTHSLGQLYEKAENTFRNFDTTTQYPPETLFVHPEEWIEDCQNKSILVLEKTEQLKIKEQLFIKQSPQPPFHKKFDLLVAHLNENKERGYHNTLFCSNEQQAKRFHDIFEEMEEKVHYQTKVLPIYEGFEDLEAQWACFSDHQIFERYHKYQLKSDRRKKETLSLKELTQMEVGDYVTHIDHGIGTFGGLQRIDVDGKWQEAIKLIYGERDILYLSIHSLHKISRYAGKEGSVPKIYKLGSKAWKALKQKTKKKVKEIAFDLIELYAKRRQKIGFAFDPDSYLQWELEASFLFEDTPDQEKATQAIKADMESVRPMDRLICGDVGFGKTEVAIRAAFKAVDNSKQVVVLVPTTILAFQHFKTFSQRLKDLPVRVDYLNRFRSTKDKNQILKDLGTGKIDILIGTHQLVNKNVVFHDLGLLIVDEEQKFGVAVKERIRSLKANIDVLTLTATPIPRTLQFSLMAARDLSIIATPPPNRYPIESEVVRFSEVQIRDGILYELQRGGQVFFIHNRVENIMEMAGLLQRLVPDARIAVGHGQMEGKKLEHTLLRFMNGEYDILIATTIIENGLDVPNANTMFIHNAQNFGLSDLHQMRGRVGRSNKKAFCYFITPPYSAMSSDAQKRIKTIEQFSAIGSGIQIAMKDLEIRGAGDLLGGEQSGFINEMGFETYQKILQQAIEELKENEFKNLYETDSSDRIRSYVKEVQIDTDLEIYIPDDYINIVKERLALYQELSQLKTVKELQEFEAQLIDRFGVLPREAQELLESVRLKWVATELGMERLILKKGSCLCYFLSDQQSDFFQGQQFQNLLTQIQKNADRMVLKEKSTPKGPRLILSISEIKEVRSLTQLLEQLAHTN
ncbi:transcription-repair coupling factor [Flavobacteriaceae bacterium]|nr:transcription-repair coupling factor [Flavobacteriaceae bacterium]MDA9588607.1 transcription-repair coupling factor [Flavobacteriaceae bacterium]MDC0872809.1 transcription-repair coupling factor [Flavobacteriaceae bacterium]